MKYMLFAGKTRKSRRQYVVKWLDPFDRVQRERWFHSDATASEFADKLEWQGINPANIIVR
jgi:hypothetical protein